MTDEQLIARALRVWAERMDAALSARMKAGEKGAGIERDEALRDRAIALAGRGGGDRG